MALSKLISSKSALTHVLAGTISALGWSVASATEVIELTEQCELSLALSAGPEQIRQEAGVYVLGDEGFELVREGTNGFRCLVQRDGPADLIPQCFDRASWGAQIQAHLETGRLVRQGYSWQEILRIRQEGFQSGRLPAPERPGLVYMSSAFNFDGDRSGGSLRLIWPHVMYYAPGLTNEDIGADMRAVMQNRGLPFIAGEGPHGYMIALIERPVDPRQAEADCAGQLPDREMYPEFPPRTN